MQDLAKEVPEIEEGVLISNFSSFGIGGKADYFFRARKMEKLISVLEETAKRNIPIFIFGGGTNILFSDDGFRGLVIRNECNDMQFEDEEVLVESGTRLSTLIALSREKRLSGLESLFGIPGTIGGAIFGNAGAFGDEICKLVKTVSIFSSKGFEDIHINHKEDCGYRTSRFKEKKEIILKIKFKLNKSKKEVITDKKIVEIRKEQSYANNVGSFFKNPVGDLTAGELLDKVGAKKMSVGKAIVLSEHANFLANGGGASCEDVLALAKKLQNKVKEKFGILLEPEVTIVNSNQGFFNKL